MADRSSADRQFLAGELLCDVYLATARDVLAGTLQELEGLELVSTIGPAY